MIDDEITHYAVENYDKPSLITMFLYVFIIQSSTIINHYSNMVEKMLHRFLPPIPIWRTPPPAFAPAWSGRLTRWWSMATASWRKNGGAVVKPKESVGNYQKVWIFHGI